MTPLPARPRSPACHLHIFYHMTREALNPFLDLDFQALHTLFMEENEKYIQAMMEHESPGDLESRQARINAIHEALRRKRIEERASRYLGYIFMV